ncbi:hypothetical protein KV557_24625 [Kitasatospora aureofaciens]|uniref:hypothetical protein n=1 Tax=Kitasatospora aureofaciens TaxID=1894 RepID=UPI001C455A44|nr:hypothetical protein [Kitasatospora aureofaciens]MBV6700250.1 hypothetical protein [Kitasatospora aureofaciens]
MTHAWYGDGAEKARVELTRSERAAVEDVRASLELDPRQGRPLPDAGPGSETYAVELLPEVTQGRGISVIYRYSRELDACLIIWLLAGP